MIHDLSTQKGRNDYAKAISTKKEIEELKDKHEAIRTVLMNNGCEEYGDCIIDEICEAIGIPPTYTYYEEGM